ncbi:hypothetical protein OG21DRAFT_1519573 [Imleria badia]|nr:hypothetical protein OG21DRAFT_1519573 [Imleria badia]
MTSVQQASDRYAHSRASEIHITTLSQCLSLLPSDMITSLHFRMRLNTSGSVDTCLSSQHVPDKITEQTLDLGVNTVHSCVYWTSKFVILAFAFSYCFLSACAADFAMILHLWAMYNRSRLILGTLLTTFCLEIIFGVVTIAIYSDPKNLSGITHGGVMCILAIVQFVRQSLQMYRVTKQWQLNRYMGLLVKQGILYFLAHVLVSSFLVFSVAIQARKLPTGLTVTFHRSLPLFGLIDVFSAAGMFPTGGSLLLPEYVPVFTLTPRFILSIRELYARDVQGRCGAGIDTGFGLSLSGRSAAGTKQNEGSDEVEEISTEVGTIERE